MCASPDWETGRRQRLGCPGGPSMIVSPPPPRFLIYYPNFLKPSFSCSLYSFPTYEPIPKQRIVWLRLFLNCWQIYAANTRTHFPSNAIPRFEICPCWVPTWGFVPFLGFIVLLYTLLPGFWTFGLVSGFDFYDQCSVDILLSACKSFSKENNWEGDCRIMEYVHMQLYQTVPNHFPDCFYTNLHSHQRRPRVPGPPQLNSVDIVRHFHFRVRGLVTLLNLHFFDD